MSNSEEILVQFEKKLKSILNSKEETRNKIRKAEEDLFLKYGIDDSEQTGLGKVVSEQMDPIYAGFDLEISDDKLAEEVHSKIVELISTKNYQIEEIEWVKFVDTNVWFFGFRY